MAQRVAYELDVPLGREVAYQVNCMLMTSDCTPSLIDVPLGREVAYQVR